MSLALVGAMLAAGLTTFAPARVAAADVEFRLVPRDLEFILRQIQISEHHAHGAELLCEDPTDTSGTCVPDPNLPWGLRTVDGSFNNLQPEGIRYGAGLEVFPRMLTPEWRDAEPVPTWHGGAPGGAPTNYGTSQNVYDAEPRMITNLIADQSTANPAAVAVAERIDGSIIEPEIVTGGTVDTVTLEDDDPALTASGVWSTLTNPARFTGGTALSTDEDGAYIEFEVADGFRWIGTRGLERGIAEITIDGASQGTVDQYDTASGDPEVLFEALDLGPGPHTVRITNTGTMHPDSGATRLVVDAIELDTVTGADTTPGTIYVPAVSPDEGLSAPFSSWFTFFGQFFDHGLDLVSKGGSGTVLIPLDPSDPLYVPGAHTNFLAVTRATNLPGADGILGTGDDIREHQNRTTPYVDQNQTYTSHPSHQVFIREYEVIDGRPVPTGHLLDGAAGGPPTWADVKDQAATVLGIELDDWDVHEVPMVAADYYGNFLPAENGLPQLVLEVGDNGMPTSTLAGDTAAPIDATQALGVGHAFLDDIAHDAAPLYDVNGAHVDGPGYVGERGAPITPHDGSHLDDHFITGDGRGNENIGLTAVHHIFHSEHNRVAEHIEEILAANPELAAGYETGTYGGVDAPENTRWTSGERLFQAARYVTEMEYQHLVFEEFARTISPTIDAQPLNETAYHSDIDAAVTAEFAHVVYRFGHSMLREDIPRVGSGLDDIPLLEGFLNPREFTAGGTLSADEGAAAIVTGMTHQTGNSIDEFVTPVLRNSLLGLPLDLAAINIARGRETGMPSLQSARTQFYAETGDSALKPYVSWRDFEQHMRNPESVVNFIAAYTDDPTVTQHGSDLDARRAAAAELAATDQFMEAADGLDRIDLWIGGMAERPMPFAGWLGSTFNHVFEGHLEDLQNGDRFYYLNRNQGLNLFHQLEANSFAELAMRNTSAERLPANMFANQDLVYDLGQANHGRPAGEAPLSLRTLDQMYVYAGAEHVTIHGTTGDDRFAGGDGDDALWGYAGDDRIEGGAGNDTVHGAAGDDIITDVHGIDTIHGGDGNDAINAGPGDDLILSGFGSDFVLHGQDVTQSFAGGEMDFVKGGNANDVLTGNEDHDWLEGAGGHDLVQGDNALTFRNDPVGGSDVLIGGSGNDDHDAEGGHDVMSNNGIDRHDGMLGFDWVTHKHDPQPAKADMDVSIFQPPAVIVMQSRYMEVEALSGWDGDDVLRGVGRTDEFMFERGDGNLLTERHLDEVDGLRDLLGGGANPPYAERLMDVDLERNSVANNILLGGGGSDILEGRGGDDVIDGDAQLDVYLEWRPAGGEVERGETMGHFQARVFSGEINPADLHIVREIVTPPSDGAVDTAVFSDVRDAYEVHSNADGVMTVSHVGGTADASEGDGEGVDSDGTDILRNVERLKFADATLDLLDNTGATGTVTISGTLQEGQELTATADVVDPDGVQASTMVFTWQFGNEADGWTTAATSTGTDTFVPTEAEIDHQMRVVVTFVDGKGAQEEVTGEPTVDTVAGDESVTPPTSGGGSGGAGGDAGDGDAGDGGTDTEVPADDDDLDAMLAPEVQGTLHRLYYAVFNRPADAAGYAYWSDQLDAGVSIWHIANLFTMSAEFKSDYGEDPTDAEFVGLLYNNVFGRDPDAAGLAYWTGILADGKLTRQSVLIRFADSAEMLQRIQDLHDGEA